MAISSLNYAGLQRTLLVNLWLPLIGLESAASLSTLSSSSKNVATAELVTVTALGSSLAFFFKGLVVVGTVGTVTTALEDVVVRRIAETTVVEVPVTALGRDTLGLSSLVALAC